MFSNFDISASGLTAQRTRMDVISDNLANVNTTRTPDGGPYRRKVPVFRSRTQKGSFSRVLQQKMNDDGDNSGRGVEIAGIREDDSSLKQVYRPEHPDADENGYVEMPNVDITSEMVDMINASRSYEANITALNTNKDMAMKALNISN
ncbi:MAG: flagellar basal body rod protein FlgC [Bacillota bacterium]